MWSSKCTIHVRFKHRIGKLARTIEVSRDPDDMPDSYGKYSAEDVFSKRYLSLLHHVDFYRSNVLMPLETSNAIQQCLMIPRTDIILKNHLSEWSCTIPIMWGRGAGL